MFWPAKFSTKFGGFAEERARGRRYDGSFKATRLLLIRNNVNLECGGALRNSFGVLGLTSVPVC